MPSKKTQPQLVVTHLLDRAELEKLLDKRRVIIAPLLDPPAQIDHVGLDLRLDSFFREFVRTKQPYITTAADAHHTVLKEIDPFYDSFYLQPGEFALAQSLEYISLPRDILCFLSGRSSLGRRGLVVHATANVVDPGWRGHLVFELANLGTMPIELVPLMRIARLLFLRTAPVPIYDGPYVGQIRITPPPPDPLVRGLLDLRLKDSR